MKANFYVQLEVTSKCNLRCRHCYVDDDYANDIQMNEYMDYISKLENFANTLNLMLSIAVTGGEPLCHSEIKWILEDLSNRKTINQIVLFTNGQLIDDELAIFLNSVGLTSVQFSVDGDQKIHDSIRGKNTYSKVFENIKKITIPKSVHFTVNNQNVRTFNKVVKDCIESGISYILVSKYLELGQSKENEIKSLTSKEWYSFFDEFSNIKEELGDQIEIEFDRNYSCLKKHRFRSVGCGIARNSLVVQSNGDLLPCRRVPIKVGNLKNDNLYDIWDNHEELKKLRERNHLKGNCSMCDYKVYCGGCRAHAYSKTGDIYETDHYCLINRV